jgi:hypothetical protein
MEKCKRTKYLRRAKVSFNPNRKFIVSAMDEYLKSGGNITRIFADDKSYQNMMVSKNRLFGADDYLIGQINHSTEGAGSIQQWIRDRP